MIPRFGICCSFQTDDYLLYTKLELIENEIKLLRQEMKLKKYEELENRMIRDIQPQITNLKSTLEIKTEIPPEKSPEKPPDKSTEKSPEKPQEKIEEKPVHQINLSELTKQIQMFA